VRAAELRQHLTCSFCNRGITQSGLPLFWCIKVTRLGLQLDAIKRQHGLNLALGSAQLGAIMGADEKLATPVMEEVTLTACEGCAMDDLGALAHIAFDKSNKTPEVPG
jgi:hypothetical protein